MNNLFNGRSLEALNSLEPACCCKPSTSLGEAISTLKARKIGSIVISSDDARALGIFTERDVLMKIVGNPEVSLDEPVENYMTKSPKCVKLNDAIEKALVLMRIGRFRHLIVVDDGEKIQSVVSIKDFLDFFLNDVAENAEPT